MHLLYLLTNLREDFHHDADPWTSGMTRTQLPCRNNHFYLQNSLCATNLKL
jgi:hypothetical protein